MEEKLDEFEQDLQNFCTLHSYTCMLSKKGDRVMVDTRKRFKVVVEYDLDSKIYRTKFRAFTFEFTYSRALVFGMVLFPLLVANGFSVIGAEDSVQITIRMAMVFLFGGLLYYWKKQEDIFLSDLHSFLGEKGYSAKKNLKVSKA